MTTSHDFLVIGSGIAGLTFALKAAEQGDVLIITKRSRQDSNTLWARWRGRRDGPGRRPRPSGGTLIAGAGLCHRVVVEICAN